MADLSITAANVVKGTGAVTSQALAGPSVTAGQSGYIDGSGLFQLGKADTLVHAAGGIIALNNAAAGQPVVYQTAGQVTIGATLTAGVVYVVSPNNSGGIAPIADIATGNYTTIIGYAATTAILQLANVVTGVAHG